MGERLFVSVSSDDVVARRKAGRPIMQIGERLAMLRELRCVNHVWVCTSEDASDAIVLFSPSVFVKGKDYEHGGLSYGEKEACRRVGAEIAFTQTRKRSSTDVIRRISRWQQAQPA
jgi:bifunctional ADP-heptose synthase (sugar kinase/adenylyltransferase)